MDVYKVLKEMNRAIEEMQEMLYNHAWIEDGELETYHLIWRIT